MEPKFVEGDRATKFELLGFAAVVILLIVLDRLTSRHGALLATDPMQALKQSVDRLWVVALTTASLFVGVAIYLLRLGVKINRSGQYPPPGMRVGVRTKIVRGRRARWNAILAFVVAGILIVVSPALVYLSYSLSRLASELSHPNKQMQPAPRNGAADLPRYA